MLQQLHNPLAIANLLFAEGKIDEKSLNEVQSKLSQEEKTRALFKLVTAREHDNSNIVWVFGSILKVTGTAYMLGKQILKNYSNSMYW